MINIFLFSFLGSIYLFCAGILFYPKKKNEIAGIYSSIFFGSCILSFIAVFLNFFFSLNPTVNNILFITITTIGFFSIFKKEIFYKLIKCCFFIALISTLILFFDTIYRPDANLYHLPYTRIINDNKIIFGISNVHFRFGHTSILQYLNAIFNNILFKEKGILIPAAIIFSSTILYFYNETIQNVNKNKVYSYFVFLLLAYILFGYNRYSEFGNDTIAHLFFLIISSYFLKINFTEDINAQEFIKILILSLFCFMLKTGLIFVFFIPLYILIFNFKKKYLLNYLNIFIIIIIISWFAKNIIVSGCLIYPVEITCLESLQWFSNDSNYLISAKAQSLDNEAWTKGWSNYNGSEVSQEYYVKNFFWLKTWFSIHGLLILKKLSIFIFILFLINFYLKKIETNDKLVKIQLNKKIIFLFFLSLFCTLMWFLRFPIFRYGSSYIVVLIISISTIFAIKNKLIEKNIKKLTKYFTIFLIIFFTLFSLKHTLRIYKNYNHSLIGNPWPKFPKTKDTISITEPKKIKDTFAYYLLKPNNDGCGYTLSPCTPFPVKNVKLKEMYGYKFYYLDD